MVTIDKKRAIFFEKTRLIQGGRVSSGGIHAVDFAACIAFLKSVKAR